MASSIPFAVLMKKYGITKVDESISTRVKTPEARTSYAFVFEARETPSGDMKFGCAFLFKKDTNLKPMVLAAMKAASMKFGADHTKWPKTLKTPFRDGDTDSDSPDYAGMIFIGSGSTKAPGVVELSNGSITPIMDQNDFYSGCIARASLSFYPYDKSGNKGVGTGLNNVLKVRDDTRLDGSVAAEDDFRDYATAEDDDAAAF